MHKKCQARRVRCPRFVRQMRAARQNLSDGFQITNEGSHLHQLFNTFNAFFASLTRRTSNPFLAEGGVEQ